MFKPLFIFLILARASYAAAAVDQDMTIEEFLQKLSTVPDIMTRKDPFIPATPPFGDREEAVKDVSTIPVMIRYSVSDYTPLAVLLGDQYPRALVRLPGDSGSKVVIVKLKDKIGNRGGIITKIEKTGLTVVENVKSPLGFVDKSVIVLPVGVKMGPDGKPVQPTAQGQQEKRN